MAITSAIMQMRRGLEADFDPDKMRPGEWAVSLDNKYVRMCFSPGVCVRMATYESFEADMSKIQAILSEVQTIEEAVIRINEEVSANADAVVEYTEQAKQFRDEAETSATNAKSSEDKAKVSETNAKVSEINAKISEENARRVAESLPEDYTELSKAFYNTAIKQKAVGDNIHVTDSADSKIVEFGLYGKAEQNGEPTPDNPIEIVVSGSDGSVEVVSCRKNLLKNTEESQTINGVTFTVNEDGSVTANGTATATAILYYVGTSLLASKNNFQNMILSGCPSGGNANSYALRVQGFNNESVGQETEHKDDIGNGTVIPNTPYSRLYIRIASGYTAENLTFYPMIRLASDTDDTYEPYTETTSTIPTPNGLCGIKVSSGGNYTDENGQQWICDEVVKYADGSGKRIKRIGVIDSYNGESVTTDYMSTTGQLTTGAKVLYVLPEPIITDLTAEEIAEIEKLYTFYPITNISNDSDCGMSITYLCDSKRYIDNKIAELANALLEATI